MTHNTPFLCKLTSNSIRVKFFHMFTTNDQPHHNHTRNTTWGPFLIKNHNYVDMKINEMDMKKNEPTKHDGVKQGSSKN
jgi:hypothetical protein